MPIYEFQCDDCDNSFETLVRAGHRDDAECPSCHGVKLSRKLSTFSGRSNGDSVSAVTAPVSSHGGCCGGGCGCH